MTDKIADYSQVVTSSQLSAALQVGGFVGVMHYLGDDFAFREEDPNIVADIRNAGIPQGGIFVVRAPSSISAVGDFNRAQAYGMPPGTRLFLDIEPGQFAAYPEADWVNACDTWALVLPTFGYSPGVYGTPVTVAACGNKMDTIWIARPGICDPTAVGLDPTYHPGSRMVQCDNGVFGGVEFDINFSQFSLFIGEPAPPSASSSGGNDVGAIVLEWNDQLHRFKTDASGTVQHAFFVITSTTSGAWEVDQPLSGLVSNAPLTFDAGFHGQLHIFGDRPDTKTAHAWFDGTSWHSEVLAV